MAEDPCLDPCAPGWRNRLSTHAPWPHTIPRLSLRMCAPMRSAPQLSLLDEALPGVRLSSRARARLCAHAAHRGSLPADMHRWRKHSLGHRSGTCSAIAWSHSARRPDRDHLHPPSCSVLLRTWPLESVLRSGALALDISVTIPPSIPPIVAETGEPPRTVANTSSLQIRHLDIFTNGNAPTRTYLALIDHQQHQRCNPMNLAMLRAKARTSHPPGRALGERTG